jgi:hypothetical protein
MVGGTCWPLSVPPFMVSLPFWPFMVYGPFQVGGGTFHSIMRPEMRRRGNPENYRVKVPIYGHLKITNNPQAIRR